MDRCFRMIEINLLVDRVIPLDEARERERKMESYWRAKIESDFDGTQNRACNATRSIHFIRHAART